MRDPLQQIRAARIIGQVDAIAVALDGIVKAVPERLRTREEWATLDDVIDNLAGAVMIAAIETHQAGCEVEDDDDPLGLGFAGPV